MASFGELSTAQRMRDWVVTMVERHVNRLRPPDQSGIILSITRTGAGFPIGDGSPDQYPPEGPGNPANLYYAQVRLDNGETVTARITSDIPVARTATWYDPDSTSDDESGSDTYWLVADGVYRKKIKVTTIDPDTGATVEQVAPEMTLPTEAPFVPPRVMISGPAGRYVVSQIIRGMVAHEDFAAIEPRAVVKDLRDGLRTHTDTITWGSAGWVGNTAYKGSGTYEGEISSGEFQSKFRFNLSRINPASLDLWHYVEPYEENRGLIIGAPSDKSRYMLLVYPATSGAVFFYLAQRNSVNWELPQPEDPFKGTLVIRHFGGDFVKVPDLPLPGSPIDDVGNRSINLTSASPIYTDSGIMDTPRHQSLGNPVLATLNHARSVLSFDGVVKAGGIDTVSGHQTLFWGGRIMFMLNAISAMPSGFLEMTMPPVGTVIKVLGARTGDVAVRESYTVVAAGIPMPLWTTLFYAPGYGQTASTNAGRYFLVDYSAVFDVPDHWILIARRMGDPMVASFVLGNGREVDAPRVLPPTGTGLTANGTYDPAYRKENGRVYLEGAFFNNTASTIGAIASSVILPAGFRPGTRKWFITLGYISSASADGVAKRVDVLNNGTINFYQVEPGRNIFLDNISFMAEF